VHENCHCGKIRQVINSRPVSISERFFSIACLCLLGASTQAQDIPLPLPLPQAGPPMSTVEDSGPRFLKPTKSIKPPSAAVPAVALQPQVNVPTVARLRRLILMPGTLTPAAMREQILASGLSSTPVTVVGMNAPAAPVLTHLASFFGSDVNADTQKKLLDTVRQGMGVSATSRAPRRVEVVGWLPTEGIMAVAVYPES